MRIVGMAGSLGVVALALACLWGATVFSSAAVAATVKPQGNKSVRTVPDPPPAAEKKKNVEKRGKYTNPYDRRIPLQGKSHEGYSGKKYSPYKRP